MRMPDSKAALELINFSGCPIAAPSANLSGSPSPTRADDVISDMDGRIDAVIIGEDCRVGIESTVVDMTGEVPVILRPGVITADNIEAAIGKKVVYDSALEAETSEGDEDFAPKSPGMKYKHYAPKAQMIVVEGSHENVKAEIERLKGLNESLGNNVGVILFEEKAFIEAAHDFCQLKRSGQRRCGSDSCRSHE